MSDIKLTNVHNISLLMSVWLAHDTYSLVPAEKKISVTTLLKSARQVILAGRLKPGTLTQDISELINARLGQAIHAGSEAAWQEPQEALKQLGYPQKTIDKIIINPKDWTKDNLPVWIEIRTEKPLGGWTISGEADAILMGAVHDIKSTGIFAYTSGSNNNKYRLQLSLYRWLNQEKVTSEMGYIEYYFKDWNKLESTYKGNYPPFPIHQQPIPLLSVLKTEEYARKKIAQIETYWDADEMNIPLCDSEDLWQNKAKWQYWGSETNKKASKNFDTEFEAIQWRNAKGKGIVKYKVAIAKACTYCNAKPICSQYKSLLAQKLIS